MERHQVSSADTLTPQEGAARATSAPRLQQALKRALDVTLAAIACLMLLPVLAGIALLIRLNSPGPVIFKQERIGWRGRKFIMLKFRTMYEDADDEPHRRATERTACSSRSTLPEGEQVFKSLQDPRITRVGRFLRTWNLDELPQLVNVLRGEMSLVGPRPALDYELPLYKEWYFARFAVRPGLTGLWQVKRTEAEDFDEMMSLDIHYVEASSMWLDLKLIMMTIPAIIRERGRY